jgi:hypothetical protein
MQQQCCGSPTGVEGSAVSSALSRGVKGSVACNASGRVARWGYTEAQECSQCGAVNDVKSLQHVWVCGVLGRCRDVCKHSQHVLVHVAVCASPPREVQV